LRLRAATLLLLLLLAFAATGAQRPLARFQVAGQPPATLAPLLAKVLESAGPVETFDVEDDERLLRRLRANALEVLATEGYFSPRIEAEPDTTDSARYILKVDLGRRARVAAVEIKFTGAIEKEPERIRQLTSSWDLDVGQPFRDAEWSGAKTRLLNRVRERDYAAARISDSMADVDADTATVRLQVDIDSGPAFTLGQLEVKGLKRYDLQLIERYYPFAPGERYDSAKLLDFQRRLQQAPYFGSVIVDIDTTGPHEDVPVRVEVTEAKTKRVAFGVGYSTNTGPRAEVTYRQALLFGYPYTLSTGAGIDRTRSVAFADILLPPKPNGANDSVGTLYEHTDIENVLTNRWAVGVARALSRTTDAATYDTQISLSYQSERRRIAASTEPEQTNDVLAATLTWSRRTVDQITDPKRGDLMTLSTTAGLRRTALGDLLQQSFVRLYGRYVRYVPLSPRDQLILRGEAGHVIVDDPALVPNEFLFRAGGVGSVRGYAYQSLGVRQGSATTGSTELLVGSAEYVRWLTDTWGAAVFYDVGDADDNLRKVRLARGYGVGARWRTLAGPLALDFAYGERVHRWRVHFFISVAF
jgi:translocation and assembly module TamA